MFSLFKKSQTTATTKDKQQREKLINDHRQAQIRSGKLPIDNVLTTERYHPKTTRLSQLAQNDLLTAIDILKSVDLDALNKLQEHKEKIESLQKSMIETLNAENKIFISGCGSAGRAGLLVTKQASDTFPTSKLLANIIPVLAGGDGSIVRAAEGFEDNKIYGVKQLQDMGWKENDLLIALTASGSADFIHAQLEHVAIFGKRNPYLLYCNSDEEVARSFTQKPIFTNQKLRNKIHCISTNVGSMALAGSTRMQAATAQILVVGIPLLDAIETIKKGEPVANWETCINTILRQINKINFRLLAPLIEEETHIYNIDQRIYYHVTPNIALNVLIDTTERSPTFNLEYFENDEDEKKADHASLCRVIINSTSTSEESWRQMLGRYPVALNWENIPHTQLQQILGYDLSQDIINKRQYYLPKIKHHTFQMGLERNNLMLNSANTNVEISFSELEKLPAHLNKLAQQIIIKLLLNTHSTLVMGRLGLYYSNLMAFVRPSNLKLISRGVRLTYELIEQTGYAEHAVIQPVIEEIIQRKDYQAIFMAIIMNAFYKKMMQLVAGESVVLEAERDVIRACLENISYQYLFREIMEKSADLTHDFLLQIDAVVCEMGKEFVEISQGKNKEETREVKQPDATSSVQSEELTFCGMKKGFLL